MGRRIITIFEILITLTLFALFSGIIITSQTNNQITEHTEEFVEMTRYKGCITEQTLADFINGFNTTVEIRIAVTKRDPLQTTSTIQSIEFMQDIVDEIQSSADHIYTMNVGDEITVSVRKPSRSFYSSIVGIFSGQYSSADEPLVAIKGGMILNTLY